jgi:hypothetical protein
VEELGVSGKRVEELGAASPDLGLDDVDLSSSRD